jgi:hypothetical protein
MPRLNAIDPRSTEELMRMTPEQFAEYDRARVAEWQRQANPSMMDTLRGLGEHVTSGAPWRALKDDVRSMVGQNPEREAAIAFEREKTARRAAEQEEARLAGMKMNAEAMAARPTIERQMRLADALRRPEE